MADFSDGKHELQAFGSSGATVSATLEVAAMARAAATAECSADGIARAAEQPTQVLAQAARGCFLNAVVDALFSCASAVGSVHGITSSSD